MSGEWSGRVGRKPFQAFLSLVFRFLVVRVNIPFFVLVPNDEILYPSTGTDGCLTRLKTRHWASGYMNVEW